jgi:FkbM family methyltransferase
MSEFHLGSMQGALAILLNKGVRFGTVIDLGCADGSFYIVCFDQGLLPGTTCVNVDANALYEPSLREIQQVLGGHYLIAAVSDVDGEVEMHTGSHPYWASALPTDDVYWASTHNRPTQAVRVPSVTLDTLVRRFALKPPFLLKLDLQGYELNALRGGESMLRDTDAIICETGYDAFAPVVSFLTDQNFGLFDLTDMSRLDDGMLCEIYPVFLNHRLDRIRATVPWDASKNETMIAGMNRRRQTIIDVNAKVLAKHRSKKDAVQVQVW